MHETSRPSPRRDRTLAVYVAIGVVAGIGYALADAVLDDLTRRGPVIDAIGAAHSFIDRVLPLVVGALLGVAVHYLRVRSALAASERRRANELHDRLHQVERDQTAWVVAAATLHDVNNPLHALGLLLDEARSLPAGDADAREELLSRAQAHVDRITKHVASLRSFTTSGMTPHAAVDLEEIATDLARTVEPIAEEEGVDVRVSATEPVRALGDPRLVRIILENLVANGLEVFRGGAGRGHIAIEVAREGESALVRVNDDGPGLERASSKPHGLGLGLSIARALAGAMKGELTATEREGWATSFVLRLPLATEAAT